VASFLATTRAAGEVNGMTGFPRFLAAVCVGLLAASCGSETPMTHPNIDLVGTVWVAETIDGAPVLADVQPVVRFEKDGRVAGDTGCNGFFGSYAVDGDRLSIGPLASTKRACAPPINDQEHNFLAALAGAQRVEFEEGLLLIYSDEPHASRFAPLPE
jgi:heat shock protein HslJ